MRRRFSISGAMGFFLTLVLQGKAADQPARVSLTLPAGVKSVQLAYLDRTDTLHTRVLELKPAANSRTATAVLGLPFTEVIRIDGTYFMLSPGDDVTAVLTNTGKGLTVAPSNISGNHRDRQRVLAVIDSIYNQPDSVYQKYTRDPRIVQYGKWFTSATLATSDHISPAEGELMMVYLHVKDLPFRHGFVMKESPEGIPEKYVPWLLSDVDVTSACLGRVADDDFLRAYILMCTDVLGKVEKPVSDRKGEEILTGPMYIIRHSASDRVKYLIANYYAYDIRYFGPNDPAWRLYYHSIDSSIQDPVARQYCDSIWASFQPEVAGVQAYDFVMESDKGKLIHLSDFRGKMVVIDWWGTWCKGCVANLPPYDSVANIYKDSAGIIFINVAWQELFSVDTWHNFLKDHHMEGHVNLLLPGCLADAEGARIIKNYHITGVPRYMAIDRDGKIIDLYMDYPENAAFAKRLAEYYQQQKSH